MAEGAQLAEAYFARKERQSDEVEAETAAVYSLVTTFDISEAELNKAAADREQELAGLKQADEQLAEVERVYAEELAAQEKYDLRFDVADPIAGNLSSLMQSSKPPTRQRAKQRVC